MIRILAALIALLSSVAQDWPKVKTVEAQSLLAQAKRIDTAMEYLGQPLPDAVWKALTVCVPRPDQTHRPHTGRLIESISPTGSSRAI